MWDDWKEREKLEVFKALGVLKVVECGCTEIGEIFLEYPSDYFWAMKDAGRLNVSGCRCYSVCTSFVPDYAFFTRPNFHFASSKTRRICNALAKDPPLLNPLTWTACSTVTLVTPFRPFGKLALINSAMREAVLDADLDD